MAKSKNIAKDHNRHGHDSRDDRDDDDWGDQWRELSDYWHDRYAHSPHNSRDNCQNHGSHENGRYDVRYDFELDLNKRCDGLDLEVDVETHGKWLKVDIEIGKLDFDFKLDARSLKPDHTPMATMIGGEGTAIGEDTLVDADISSRLLDLGRVTVAFGSATFKSAAVTDGDGAFAISDTFAGAAGADLVFVFTTKATTAGSYRGDSYITETSTTNYIAIDFEDFDFAEGQLSFNFYDSCSYLFPPGAKGGGSRIPNLDGNLAMLDVDASANAQNTLVDVLASVLALEDQLSTISAMAVTAGG